MHTTPDLMVTSISDLVEASRGTLVELPPFIEGKPFVARLKRPSMMAMVRAGKIPNELLNTANKLFVNNSVDTDNEKAMDNLFGVLDAVCEACFVEPTYAQIKDAGIQLTDDQYMFIFNYTQKGVRALETFHNQFPNTVPTEDVEDVQQDAQ